MTKHSFEAYRDGYSRLWNGVEISPNRQASVSASADAILKNRARYEHVEKITGVPWFIVGVIHKMEANCDFSKHLHNGDSLKARTWQVPAGRPRAGSPPFSWEESAVDALQYDGLDRIQEWSIERIAFALEKFNGFGYRKFGVPSPYLWSFTNRYVQGKYVKDGVWSATAVSQQSGAMALIKEISTKEHFDLDTSVVGNVAVNEEERLPPAKTPSPIAGGTIWGAFVAFLGWIGVAINDWISSAVSVAAEAISMTEGWLAPLTSVATMIGANVGWMAKGLILVGLLTVVLARVNAHIKGKVG